MAIARNKFDSSYFEFAGNCYSFEASANYTDCKFATSLDILANSSSIVVEDMAADTKACSNCIDKDCNYNMSKDLHYSNFHYSIGYIEVQVPNN